MIRESFTFPFLLFPFPSRFLFFPKTFQSSILLTLQLVNMNNPNIEMTPSTVVVLDSLRITVRTPRGKVRGSVPSPVRPFFFSLDTKILATTKLQVTTQNNVFEIYLS